MLALIGSTTFPWSCLAKAVYGASLYLLGEFLDSKDLPPREFLDRIQSALRGLTLPPSHHMAPSTACVPAALASAEFVLSARMPLYSLFLSCTVDPSEFSVARKNCSSWKLVLGWILFQLTTSNLSSVMSSILNSLFNVVT